MPKLLLFNRRRLNTGGYPFPADPTLSAIEQTVFWSPSVAPAIVSLVPVRVEKDTAESPSFVLLADLPSAIVRKTSDGWHMALRRQNADHHAWFRHRPRTGTRYAAELPLDTFFELRAHAARRLWRILSGRSPGAEFRTLPAQRRTRLTQSLRALDARRDHASYRTIAIAIFGLDRLPASAWKTHDLRSRTIRLVEAGYRLMREGYRDLLSYPLPHR
jgi:hypothetical protein